MVAIMMVMVMIVMIMVVNGGYVIMVSMMRGGNNGGGKGGNQGHGPARGLGCNSKFPVNAQGPGGAILGNICLPLPSM